MRSAILTGDVVTNIIEGVIPLSIPITAGRVVSIGWTYDGTNFVPPDVAPEPEEFSPLNRTQFAQSLFIAGVITSSEAISFVSRNSLPQIAIDVINAVVDPNEKAMLQINLYGFETVQRAGDLMAKLQTAASLTDAQVDDLFRSGINL